MAAEPTIVEMPGVRTAISERDLGRMRAESPERQAIEREMGVTFASIQERVKVRFDLANKYRRGHELTWLLCVAYYIGDQYAQVDNEAMRILTEKDLKTPRHRVRMVVNQIMPAVNNLVSQLTRSQPTLAAKPATEDAADVEGSMTATSVLMHEWIRQNATELDHDAKTWKTICGTAGLWYRWNEVHGPLRENEQGQMTGVPTGEIETVVLPPFNLYPDPGGSRMRNMRFFIVAMDEDVEALKEAYPEVEGIGPDASVRSQAERYERRLRMRMGASLGAHYEVPSHANSTTMMHYYEPRSRKFPDGLMAICTVSACLWMGPNPWAHSDRWIPVRTVRHNGLSASYWGEGAVAQAIPIQKQINKYHSQITEHGNLTTRGRYWIPMGCRVNTSKMTGEPGEKIWYKAPPAHMTAGGRAYRPEREDPPRYPQGLYRHLEKLEDKLDDIFNYHPATRGVNPTGGRSAAMIDTLIERDEVNQYPIQIRDNLAWQQVGRGWLMLAKDQWTDERLVEVRGDEGEVEIRSFRGADIPAYLNVIVEADNLLPTTRGARIAALERFAERGILTPLEVRQAIFENFGTIKQAMVRLTRDETRARRENALMMRAVLCEVKRYDNHVVHLQTLNDFRKTASFERMEYQEVVVTDRAGQPVGVATLGEIFEYHAQGHALVLQEAGFMPERETGLPAELEMTTPGGPSMQAETAGARSTPAGGGGGPRGGR